MEALLFVLGMICVYAGLFWLIRNRQTRNVDHTAEKGKHMAERMKNPEDRNTRQNDRDAGR